MPELHHKRTTDGSDLGVMDPNIWAKHHGMIKRKGERGARSKIQILHFADEGRRHGSNQQRGAAASQTSHFPEYV